ncbi:MAG: hypothetical protein H0W76_03790 [Pyrinomonadaceae bacterium]|nr:hypothetical protein [Pyrinomonadaceae bacterium]
MNVHEEMFARVFIIPEKRDRYVTLIGSVKGRKKILNGFHHIHDLDGRYAKSIPSNEQSAESIFRMLKQKGAPEMCYIMSDDSDIDQTEMPLRAAISRVEGSNFGTLISCIAGKSAYFETEDIGGRYILER